MQITFKFVEWVSLAVESDLVLHFYASDLQQWKEDYMLQCLTCCVNERLRLAGLIYSQAEPLALPFFQWRMNSCKTSTPVHVPNWVPSRGCCLWREIWTAAYVIVLCKTKPGSTWTSPSWNQCHTLHQTSTTNNSSLQFKVQSSKGKVEVLKFKINRIK